MNNLPVVIALAGTVTMAAYLGYRIRKHRPLEDRDLALLAFIASLLTLCIATWQNSLAARDAARSSEASIASARAAEASLSIERAPALTINCSMRPSGHEDQTVLLTPNQHMPMGITMPWPQARGFNRLACNVHNFSRQPVIAAVIPMTYEFYRVIRPGQARTVGKSTQIIYIDGIAAQSAYSFAVENHSVRLDANVIVPQLIEFAVPPTDNRITYHFPRYLKYSVNILDHARLPVAPSASFLRQMP